MAHRMVEPSTVEPSTVELSSVEPNEPVWHYRNKIRVRHFFVSRTIVNSANSFASSIVIVTNYL